MLWIYRQENINFIEELMTVEKESVMDALERVLKQEKESLQQIPADQRKELDKRLKSYSENPEDLLDWEKEKQSW